MNAGKANLDFGAPNLNGIKGFYCFRRWIRKMWVHIEYTILNKAIYIQYIIEKIKYNMILKTDK